MEKYKLLYIIGVIALAGCGSNNESAAEGNRTHKKNSPKTIKKHIPIGAKFTHLTSVSGADIIYTQGDYDMEIEGDSALIQYLDANFDANLLTISFGSERNPDLNAYEGKLNITIRLSAPELQCVSICSSGGFASHGKWEGDRLELGIIGTGSFTCDSIACNTFDMQSTGKGNATFSYIDAETAHFASTYETAVSANINTKLLMAENQGSNDFTFTGTILKKELYQTKKGKILFE